MTRLEVKLYDALVLLFDISSDTSHINHIVEEALASFEDLKEKEEERSTERNK